VADGIPFTGGSARTGPLTLGQANILRSLLEDGHQLALGEVVETPPGTTVAAVAAAVRALVLHHESLRTTYAADEQIVRAAGTIPFTVEEAADPAIAAGMLSRRLWTVRFDVAAELPVRTGVVTVGGEPRYVALAVSHLAADSIAMSVLADQLRRLLAGKAIAPVVMAPVDLALWERSASMRRRLDASRGYWAEALRATPHSLFPPAAERTSGHAYHQVLQIRSAPAAAAVAEVARRTGAGSSVVMLAAVVALLARCTSLPAVPVASPSANRFLPDLRLFVGTVATDAFLTIDLSGAAGFDEAVRRTAKAALPAHRHSWYDPAEIWRLIRATSAERGIAAYRREFVFNNFSWTEDAGHVEPDGFTWLPPETRPARFNLDVRRLTGVLTLGLWADPACLPPAGAEGFGRALVRFLAAAGARDVPLSEIDTPALSRGADWRLVDAGWVRLGATHALLGEVLGDAPFLLHHADRLECYIAHPSLTPAEVHRAVVGRLPSSSATMAPQWYAVCADPPRSSTVDGWRAQPARVAGDGR
jgi:hypothetical protein